MEDDAIGHDAPEAHSWQFLRLEPSQSRGRVWEEGARGEGRDAIFAQVLSLKKQFDI